MKKEIKTQDNRLNGNNFMPSKRENAEKEILLRPFTTRNETNNNCRYHSRNIIVFNILFELYHMLRAAFIERL